MMRWKVKAIVLLALAVSLPGFGWRSGAAAPACSDSLAICDRAYEEGDTEASATIAREILTRQPESYAAAWRLSRALIRVGNLAEDEQCRRLIMEDAQAHAARAVGIDSTGSEGFTCLAICAGNLSGLAGGRRRIELAEEARTAARKAIDLDGNNDLAHLVLGVWNREVATLSGLTKLAAGIFYGGAPAGASLEESATCLRRAVTLAPEHINHHRQLGITLMSMGHCDEAIAAFEQAVALESRSPVDRIHADDARRRLAQARLRRDAPEAHGLY